MLCIMSCTILIQKAWRLTVESEQRKRGKATFLPLFLCSDSKATIPSTCTCPEGESTWQGWLEGTFLEPWYCDPNWIFFSRCCALVQLNLLTLDLWYMVHKKWCGMTQKYNYSESLHWFQVFQKPLGFPGLKKILWKFLFSWVLEN